LNSSADNKLYRLLLDLDQMLTLPLRVFGNRIEYEINSPVIVGGHVIVGRSGAEPSSRGPSGCEANQLLEPNPRGLRIRKRCPRLPFWVVA
jgi:hypothetical protein